MPRRALDLGSKPFEIKVGIGFAAFGGMYRLGDPSMCPPNRFRRLVNVRLGEKDVISRPGLTVAFDSTSANPVVNIFEIGDAEFTGIWIGAPSGTTFQLALPVGFPTPPPYPNPIARLPLFARVDLVTGATRYFITHSILNPLGFPMAPDVDEIAIIQQGPRPQTGSPLAPVGPFPEIMRMFDPVLVPVTPNIVLDNYNLFGEVTNLFNPFFGVFAEPQDRWASIPPPPATNGFLWANTFTNFGSLDQRVPSFPTFPAPLAREIVGAYPRERMGCCCMDVLVQFRGSWLCAGNFRGDQWPAALGLGQPIYEVVFAPDVHEPPELYDPSYVPAGPPTYSGNLRLVFRMPGVCTATRPLRAAGGIDGRLVRSMATRTIRADNQVTGASGVLEKLFIGTYGGFPDFGPAGPDIPSPLPFPSPFWIEPVHRPYLWTKTDGDVYSYDGTTLQLEKSGLGPCVTVIELPDGSILACGLTAASMLDSKDDVWKPVTYATPATVNPWQRDMTVPLPFGAFGLTFPVPADVNWDDTGYLWTSRVIHAGEAYFAGWDLAPLYHTRKDMVQFHAASTTVIGNVPQQTYKDFTTAAFVIAKFDRATMTMVIVRRGTDIWTTLKAAVLLPFPFDAQATAFSDLSSRIKMNSGILSSDGERLYYSHNWGEAIAGFPFPSRGRYIGAYDGVSWSDALLYDGTSGLVDAVTLLFRDVVSAVSAGGVVYLTHAYSATNALVSKLQSGVLTGYPATLGQVAVLPEAGWAGAVLGPA